MNSAEIEAFLAICRYKNISKASEELFISQSSLSSRLRSLEERLGCPLLLRGKGSREVTLTTWGQAFYELAVQYQKITEKMEALNRSSLVESITVSTIHSVGTHVLLPVFERFLQKYPQIRLGIQDLRAEMAVSSLICGKTDVAFSTSNIQTTQIVSTPFLSDPMTFLCSTKADFPDTVTLDMLPLRDEAYVLWSAECEQWHNSVFGTEIPPSITVDLDDQISLFISKYNKWAFAPLSVAESLVTNPEIRRCKTAFQMPNRTIYILRDRNRAETDNIIRFLNTLREVLTERKITGLML